MQAFENRLRPWHWTRRRMLGVSAASLGVLAVTPSAMAMMSLALPEGVTRYAFDVLRGKSTIGWHIVEFRETPAGLEVNSRIDVNVKILGISVFRYRHEGTETWRDGLLQAYESETLDDDAEFWVQGKAVADGFEVHGRKEDLVAPPDVAVASYWTAEILSRPLVIEPKRGRLKPQTVHGVERAVLRVGQDDLPVTRYAVGGVNRGTVDYDDAGRWVGAVFEIKRSAIVYRFRA